MTFVILRISFEVLQFKFAYIFSFRPAIWDDVSYEKFINADHKVHLSFKNEIDRYKKQYPTKKPLVLSKEVLAFILVAFNMKKGSALVGPIGNRIERAQSSGVHAHFLSKYDVDYDRKFQSGDVPRPLTLDDLCGIFYVCALFYFCSFLVVVGEIHVSNLSRNWRSWFVHPHRAH